MHISKKIIYLDIDGVILTKGGMPAAHLEEMLTYITKNYSVFWLTSRCKGDSIYTVSYLSKFIPKELIPLIKKINPTDYRIDKTEAINWEKDFFWLDDELFDSEKRTLTDKGKFHSWVEIDLITNPNQLLDLIYTKLNRSFKFPKPIPVLEGLAISNKSL